MTGGAQGIGEATVRRFVKEGAKVIIWDLVEDKGKRLAEDLKGDDISVFFDKVDTTNMDTVIAAFDRAVSEFGKIDILVNNAGITRDASLKKMTVEQWQSVIDVNLTGVFNCTKVVAEHMTANGYGRIANASSVVGVYGNFGQTNYVATKAGVIGMTKTWARELGRKGVTVNAVAPGFIGTEMVQKMPQNVIDMMVEKTPVQRLGTPEDIAAAYVFLCSEESSFINGATLHVDGGIVM